MGDARYARCKGCGKSRDEVGELSWTRLCTTCALTRVESNVNQMVARSGPNFDLWRKRMAACVGAALLDEAMRSRHSAE